MWTQFLEKEKDKMEIEYGTDKPLILMVEKDKNAQKLADMIRRTEGVTT